MKRSLEDRVLNLEISNLYQSVTPRLIDIYDEQQGKLEQRSTSDDSLDVREAARRLRVSPGLVRKLVRERRLGYHRIGRLIRFSQQDIDDFISSQKKDIRKKLPRIIKKLSATRQVGEAARGNSYGVCHAVPNPSLVVGEVAQRVPQWMSLSSLGLNSQKSDFPLNRVADETKIANYQQKRLNEVGSGLCHHEFALQTFTPPS